MALNWVMLHETEGFIRLPQERIIYTSPPRTSLSLQSLHPRPGNEPLSIQSSTGCVHLTNQRIVYLPMQSTPQFQSFTAPLLNLRDTHVSAPFFGPNVWTAQVQPIAGGGIPPSSAAVQLRMTFKDGGAFDFHSNFEKIKERLQQAVENVDSSGLVGDGAAPHGTRGGANALAGINFSAVHLEQLPAYEGPGGSDASLSPTPPGISSHLSESNDQSSHSRNTSATQANEERLAAPTGPPPGYEEVQQQSVANALEDSLRQLQ